MREQTNPKAAKKGGLVPEPASAGRSAFPSSPHAGASAARTPAQIQREKDRLGLALNVFFARKIRGDEGSSDSFNALLKAKERIGKGTFEKSQLESLVPSFDRLQKIARGLYVNPAKNMDSPHDYMETIAPEFDFRQFGLTDAECREVFEKARAKVAQELSQSSHIIIGGIDMAKPDYVAQGVSRISALLDGLESPAPAEARAGRDRAVAVLTQHFRAKLAEPYERLSRAMASLGANAKAGEYDSQSLKAAYGACQEMNALLREARRAFTPEDIGIIISGTAFSEKEFSEAREAVVSALGHYLGSPLTPIIMDMQYMERKGEQPAQKNIELFESEFGRVKIFMDAFPKAREYKIMRGPGWGHDSPTLDIGLGETTPYARGKGG